ncbi:condensation domain-containing protein [Nocardiopsis sp. CNR-923]|uniref:condensation domain-containing protein n=1 Tax=Nocardiopsis sp. CNR-923 TaxID=1904965 RepID=UPI0009FAD82C
MPRTHAPVSPGQERLLWLHELDPDSDAYHIFLPVLFQKGVDRPALDRSLARLVDRHPVLTVRFVREPSGAVTQTTTPDFRVPVEELPAPTSDDWERAARSIMAAPFALFTSPSPRVALIRCGDGSDVAVLALHHTVGDGRSMRTLHHDLTAFYRHETGGARPDLPQLSADYLSFAALTRPVRAVVRTARPGRPTGGRRCAGSSPLRSRRTRPGPKGTRTPSRSAGSSSRPKAPGPWSSWHSGAVRP